LRSVRPKRDLRQGRRRFQGERLWRRWVGGSFAARTQGWRQERRGQGSVFRFQGERCATWAWSVVSLLTSFCPGPGRWEPTTRSSRQNAVANPKTKKMARRAKKIRRLRRLAQILKAKTPLLCVLRAWFNIRVHPFNPCPA
jgi:hypothetical protein